MHIIQTQSSTLTNVEALAHVQEVHQRYGARKGYEDKQTSRFKGLCRTVGEVQRYLTSTPSGYPSAKPLPPIPQPSSFQSSDTTPSLSSHPSRTDGAPATAPPAAPLQQPENISSRNAHGQRPSKRAIPDTHSSVRPKQLTQHIPYLLERLSKDHPCLLKREKLAICNLRPTDETQLGVIVEDLEDRMDEREQERLVGVLGEVFAGGSANGS